MLIITRQADETISITPTADALNMTLNEAFGSKGISLRIFEVKNKQVRIGIQAPEKFSILRGELQP